MTHTIKNTLILSMLLLPVAVFAQDNEDHNRSIADVVGEITQSQNISSQKDIRCDAVTEDQFEDLGDAVMQVMIGNDEQHEYMDNMMGGEGSASLRSVHIAMGQRYLGCAQGTYGTIGMMGGMMSMFGTNWRSNNGLMMDNLYGPWGMTPFRQSGQVKGGASMLLFWIIVIVGVILLVKLLSGQRGVFHKGKSALDLLKERYAKGEINKEEFDVKKKDLL